MDEKFPNSFKLPEEDKKLREEQERLGQQNKKIVEEKLQTLPKIKNPFRVKFRLTGVKRELAEKVIELDKNDTVEIAKLRAYGEYKLNTILTLNFMFKGRVMVNDEIISKLDKDPNEDQGLVR